MLGQSFLVKRGVEWFLTEVGGASESTANEISSAIGRGMMVVTLDGVGAAMMCLEQTADIALETGDCCLLDAVEQEQIAEVKGFVKGEAAEAAISVAGNRALDRR